MTYFNKEEISTSMHKKVQAILDKPEFSEEKLQTENPVFLYIRRWAIAVFEYNDEVNKAKKSMNVDEIVLVQRVFKAVFIMLKLHDFTGKTRDVDPKLLKD
jgi:hypothetical protein